MTGAPEGGRLPDGRLTGLLHGQVVMVCGAGPGLGRSIAVRSAAAGADVVVAARTKTRLDKVLGDITATGQRGLAVEADVTDADSARQLADAALAEFGRIDVLVHNAFAIPPLTPLMQASDDAVRAGIEVSVLAALRMTRLLVPALATSHGSVILINSAVLRHSRLTFGPYKIAKSALLALADSLATELGPQGIRVNTVAPGYIWSGSLRWYFRQLAEARGVDPQLVYDEAAATTDLRRLPEPDEIADAVLFLASPLARAITGQCLDVNCGEFHH